MTQPTSPSPIFLAKKMLRVLESDLCGDYDGNVHNEGCGRPGLRRIDDYRRGYHDDPYMPPHVDAEYVLLAKRSITNVCTTLEGTPAQALYVDGYRRGQGIEDDVPDSAETLPEWEHWQNSRMDARQTAVHRSALAYGHSFVLTEKRGSRVISKGLSPLRTTALYEDPANDDAPYAALTVTEWGDPSNKVLGRARMWTATHEYSVTFVTHTDMDSVKVDEAKARRHGASECPVTRFAPYVDLDGRTYGVIEPMIPLQNRINQSVFDLLVTQTYNSFQVRTGTGMVPPLKTRAVYRTNEDGSIWKDANGNPEIIDTELVRDPVTGQPIPEKVDINARRVLFAKDKDARWGSLPGTPLDGFIASIDMSFRHFSALGQVPPHHLLGQIANLSADALRAAETSLLRMLEEFRKVFGESWERVFRVAGQLLGLDEVANNYLGEVVWRDMEMRSLSQAADGLGKLKEQLEVPPEGLLDMIPNVTAQKVRELKELMEKRNTELQMAEALNRATPDEPTDTGE